MHRLWIARIKPSLSSITCLRHVARRLLHPHPSPAFEHSFRGGITLSGRGDRGGTGAGMSLIERFIRDGARWGSRKAAGCPAWTSRARRRRAGGVCRGSCSASPACRHRRAPRLAPGGLAGRRPRPARHGHRPPGADDPPGARLGQPRARPDAAGARRPAGYRRGHIRDRGPGGPQRRPARGADEFRRSSSRSRKRNRSSPRRGRA